MMIKLRITDIEGCRQFFTGISKEGEPFTIRVNAYATVEVETASIHDSLQVGIERGFVLVEEVEPTPAEEPVGENQAEEVKPKKSRVKKEGEE
jgi:hypothetical protein